MSRAYLFIDGAAFAESVDSPLAHFGATIRDINWASLSKNAERIFYFDALPVQKPAENVDKFNERLTAKKSLFAYLRRIPNMHVREGFTRVRPTGKNPPLRQKGVDIALAVEVLTHAHSGNFDEARIIANDLDFYPLLDALTNTRVKTLLYFNRRKTANELLEAADVAEEIGFYAVWSWLPSSIRDKETIEGRNAEIEASGLELVSTGVSNFGECLIHRIKGSGKFLLVGSMGDRGIYECVSTNLELLRSHFEATASFPVEWLEINQDRQG
jgi:uncharacterized LabA/DUF88 family protein